MGKKKIGKIVGFHGLRGDVKVRPSSSSPAWLDTLKRVTLVLPSKKTLELSIRSMDAQNRLVLMRFKDCPDRTSVEPYLGAELMVDDSELPAPADDEFYVDELIGMTVLEHQDNSNQNRSNQDHSKVIGVVKDVISSTGQDFLEVQVGAGLELIPITDHFVAEVDAAERRIYIQHLDGFFPDEVQ